MHPSDCQNQYDDDNRKSGSERDHSILTILPQKANRRAGHPQRFTPRAAADFIRDARSLIRRAAASLNSRVNFRRSVICLGSKHLSRCLRYPGAGHCETMRRRFHAGRLLIVSHHRNRVRYALTSSSTTSKTIVAIKLRATALIVLVLFFCLGGRAWCSRRPSNQIQNPRSSHDARCSWHLRDLLRKILVIDKSPDVAPNKRKTPGAGEENLNGEAMRNATTRAKSGTTASSRYADWSLKFSKQSRTSRKTLASGDPKMGLTA